MSDGKCTPSSNPVSFQRIRRDTAGSGRDSQMATAHTACDRWCVGGLLSLRGGLVQYLNAHPVAASQKKKRFGTPKMKIGSPVGRIGNPCSGPCFLSQGPRTCQIWPRSDKLYGVTGHFLLISPKSHRTPDVIALFVKGFPR